MDISIIKPEMVTDKGLVVGDPDAPAVMKEFLNLKCPYCKKWFELSAPIVKPYLEEGKLKIIFKPFDKEKTDLIAGNIAQHHLPYDDPKAAYEAMTKLFATRSEWGNLSESEIDTYVEKLTSLPKQPQEVINKWSNLIINEAQEAVIQFVPTVILGDHIFDEGIEPATLKAYIENELRENE